MQATTNIAEEHKMLLIEKVLISPKYRGLRHILLLIITCMAIFCNTMAKIESASVKTFTLFFIIDLSFVYLNIYFFIPHYINKKHYITYLWLFFTLFILLYFIKDFYLYTSLGKPIPNIFAILINFFSYLFSALLFFGGLCYTMAFKQLSIENNRVSRMEKEHLRSQVEWTKEQIRPNLLFNVLHKTGDIAATEQTRASKMLMQLSKLLRYQLYESNKNVVFLNSEIEFTKNYLELEKTYSQRLNYEVSITGDMNILVPPLIFISFIQSSVLIMKNENENPSLKVIFESIDNKVKFSCISNCKNVTDNSDFSKIRQRLDYLFPEKYFLRIENGNVFLVLNV